MSKRKRTRFLGAYSESPAPAIDLPFTLANLRALLAEGARPDARYTHQQIKDWADRFWWTQSEQVVFQGGDVPAAIAAAADLARRSRHSGTCIRPIPTRSPSSSTWTSRTSTCPIAGLLTG